MSHDVGRLSEVFAGAVAGDGTLIRGSDGGLGVHYISETGEAFSMRILREESGRWKASLSGPSFQITESFASESEAEQRVGGWFRRAFPSHVCDSRCEADAKPQGEPVSRSKA